MIPRNRSTRVAAAVGATVAAGAVAMLGVTTTASADEPGRCTQNVNVREEADATSRIVALCEAGTQVTIGPERDGWAYLENLHGWASRDYIDADDAPAPATGDAHSSSDSSEGSSTRSASDPGPGDEADADGAGSDDEADRPGGTARIGGRDVGGLLGG